MKCSVVGTPYPGRTVTSLDVTVFKPDGTVVGTQSVSVQQVQPAAAGPAQQNSSQPGEPEEDEGGE